MDEWTIGSSFLRMPHTFKPTSAVTLAWLSPLRLWHLRHIAAPVRKKRGSPAYPCGKGDETVHHISVECGRFASGSSSEPLNTLNNEHRAYLKRTVVRLWQAEMAEEQGRSAQLSSSEAANESDPDDPGYNAVGKQTKGTTSCSMC